MNYNIYGVLLDVNVRNNSIRDFFNSKFSSFGYGFKSFSGVVKTVSILEISTTEFFQALDDDKSSTYKSNGVPPKKTVDYHGHEYYLKKICNSYVAWNDSNCLFYLANDESHILAAVCGYLLKCVINALSEIGIICLHGAGVTLNHSTDKGLFILGPSGSGKSSISIKLVEKYGESIICDDVLMIKRELDGVMGLSNRQFVNVEKNNLKKNYSDICHCVVKSVDPFNTKVKIDLNMFSQDAFASVIMPRAIVFLTLERSDACTIVPLKSTAALKRIVKEMQFYITPKYVPIIYDLIKQCTVYEINPSKDIEMTINEIYRVLSEKNYVSAKPKDN